MEQGLTHDLSRIRKGPQLSLLQSTSVIIDTSEFTENSLRDMEFSGKWLLVVNSLAFMAVALLMMIVSWKSRRSEKD